MSLWDEASDNFLIAKGTFSLVELRGKAVAPTWFSFYGYGHVGEELDATEHPPTVPLGRLLLSARCRRLSGREEMQPNQVVFAKALDLPESVPRYLMADVYEVQRSGNSSPGEAVQVIVSVGGVENATPIKRAATGETTTCRLPSEFQRASIISGWTCAPSRPRDNSRSKAKLGHLHRGWQRQRRSCRGHAYPC